MLKHWTRAVLKLVLLSLACFAFVEHTNLGLLMVQVLFVALIVERGVDIMDTFRGCPCCQNR